MPSGLIIVTGGSRGIGAAICRRLVADGHAVAVNYTADAKAAEATVAEIRKSGGRAQAFQADVADSAQIHRLFEQATEALGPLAGLVNNAGVSGRFATTAAGRSSTFRRSPRGLAACQDWRPMRRPRERSRASPRASQPKSGPRASGPTSSRPASPQPT
jgi:NAD(P)-dependent dehydrogenase (short-subunit alcohol dehydrogenase family)